MGTYRSAGILTTKLRFNTVSINFLRSLSRNVIMADPLPSVARLLPNGA